GSPWLTAFAQRSPFAEMFKSLGKHRSGASQLLAELAELPQEEWPGRLRRLLSEQIGLILRRTIDADRPLTDYGLDSLANHELRARVEAETGVRISTADITTIRGMADCLYDKLTSKADIAAAL
ncbi:poly(3-hydroxyalkanoate) depolymerase, partial [Mycobacterium angelicum]